MIGRIRAVLMQRKLVTAIIVLLACGVVFGAVRYSRRSPSVPTIEVKRTEFLDSVQFRGECTALKSLSITAPADAGDLQILKIAADGAKVKPGDMIVEFDKTKTEQDLAQFRSTLKYSTADIDQTRAQSRITEEQDLTAVSKARFDLESAKLDAGKQEIVSKIEGEEAKLKVRNAEQTLREAEQKLNSDRAAAKASIQGKVETSRKAAFDVQRAETALSKMTLKAPAAGMVSLVPVWHGGNVSPFKPGDRAWPGTPLAELPDPGSIRVTAHVDETERGRLASFQKEGETLAYVWSGSKFRPQAIEISRRSGDRVLVAKGLQAGDRIALQDPAAGKSE
jgi:HlyD family secretion protein